MLCMVIIVERRVSLGANHPAKLTVHPCIMYLDAPVYIWGVQVYMSILQERRALPVDAPWKLAVYP